MVVLDGIKNFLEFVNQNWTSIAVVIGLAIAVTKKVIAYFSKSDEEKIEIAKNQIKETMLKLITEAEKDYDEWKLAGSIKRAQVIDEIFANYPILSKVTDQKELIKWIDDAIDDSLVTLRKIVEENRKQQDVM